MKNVFKNFQKSLYSKLLAVVITLLIANCLSAQSNCNVFIKSSFESKCIHSLEERLWYDEYGVKIIACKGNTVTYNAEVSLSENIDIVSVNWNVSGYDNIQYNSDNSITVTWGNSTTGQIYVEVLTNDGNMCSRTKNVLLIDRPIASASTQPAYNDLSGVKVIRVCIGETIYFTDESLAPSSDLISYFWTSPYGNASTKNYVINDVQQDCEVIHRVENNCGCYDEEIYRIEVIHGNPLELSCYGTVCEGSTVTYSIINQTCNNYFWSVENGTIISGQHTPQVTVNWKNAQDGYGVISLDGNQCGNYACPNMMSVKIPIISDNVTIDGQTTVCEGEAVLYSLPLWGSTDYSWNVTTTNGNYSIENSYGPNERLIIFKSAGTYNITVRYVCPFLDCGPFVSATKTVTVKPKLEIEGENRVCENHSLTFTTNPAVNATWRVYKSNGSTLTTQSNTSVFSYTFTTVGKYKITATNSNYCSGAEFWVEVKAAPNSPTMENMDADNPTVACPNSAILLKGESSHPNYNLVWEPVCSDASPNEIFSNEATINYGNTVCDINVYNYDKILGCKSSSAYIHHVSEFTLADAGLPQSITTCPGSKLYFSVPYQKNVLYKWEIGENEQHYASVQGDHLQNNIILLVNDVPNFTNTYSFFIRLTRTYCSGLYEIIPIEIVVEKLPTANLHIESDNDICTNDEITLTAFNGNTQINAEALTWYITNHNPIYSQNPVDIDFNTPGQKNATIYFNPYEHCNNSKYYQQATKIVNVHEKPIITNMTHSSAKVWVNHPAGVNTSNYEYHWTVTLTDGTTPNVQNTNPTDFVGYGQYCCTISNKYSSSASCDTAYCITFNNTSGTGSGGSSCKSLDINTTTIDECLVSKTFSVGSSYNNVSWTVSSNASLTTNNNSATIVFNKVGTYTITASASKDNDCYKGSCYVTIDYIPNFIIEKKCNSVIINNKSQYLYPTTVTCTIKDASGNTISTFSFQSYQTSQIYTFASTPSGTYYFEFSCNGHNCPAVEVTFDNTPSNLSITTSNPAIPNHTCDNTPITLTLNSNGTPLNNTDIHWNFGDESVMDTNQSSIDHTFEYELGGISVYDVVATIEDANGCPDSATIKIFSYPNNDGLYLTPEGTDTCQGIDRIIQTYKSSSTIWNHDWGSCCNNAAVTDMTNTYILGSVKYTNNYFLKIQDYHYCKREAMTNVGFKNLPYASIAMQGNKFCKGDKIQLSGKSGADDTYYTYQWSVTDDNGNSIAVDQTGITSFTAENVGTYYISLHITDNSSGCESDIAHTTLTVYPTPSAPDITFGNNMCINNPPVKVQAVSPTEVYWSNGVYSHIADYYHSGWATAYYYDQTSGCKSEENAIYIEPAPNFDALLTGCYQKCRDFFPTTIQAFGITPNLSIMDWKWYRNNNLEANGSGNYVYNPLILPLSDFGSYHLNTQYFNGNCGAKSPSLTISPKEFCNCDNIEIDVRPRYSVRNCRISYTLLVDICNHNDYSVCFSSLEPLFRDLIANNDVSIDNVTYPPIINPNDCGTITINLTINNFGNYPCLDFRLYDTCNNCTKDFSFCIEPRSLNCSERMDVLDFNLNPSLSSDYTGYFKFTFNVSPTQEVLACWTNPTQIINYTYDNSTYALTCLAMFNTAELVQMLKEGRPEVCFYAITCIRDSLCLKTFCIPVNRLLNMLIDNGFHIDSEEELELESEEEEIQETEIETKSMKQSSLLNTPTLIPNPAVNEVNIAGLEDDVTQILIMDMQGKQISSFENTKTFSIASFTKGSYIVRIKDENNNIWYLKLIKQ